MTTTRLARPEDLPFLAGIEDAGDTLFAERFGGVEWPAASTGEERAAEPGILLVAVADDGTVIGFTHVLDLDGHWHLEQIAVDPAHGRPAGRGRAARGARTPSWPGAAVARSP